MTKRFNVAYTQIVIDKINMQKQSISDFNTNYNLKNSEKIWKRINQYLKEFSEKL